MISSPDGNIFYSVTTQLIHVWLVEDDAYYRRAIARLLDAAEGIVVTRAFAACESALEALQPEEAPEVILLDIGLPGMSGTKGARLLKTRAPETQIVMLTVHEDEEYIFDALCAGASGYLLKYVPGARIVEAIHEVVRGGVPFTAPIARKMLHLFARGPSPKADYGLSDREKEVLERLAQGHTQKEIAERLFLSPHTVETRLRRIYAKLHVRNGLAAVSKAIRERLI